MAKTVLAFLRSQFVRETDTWVGAMMGPPKQSCDGTMLKVRWGSPKRKP